MDKIQDLIPHYSDGAVKLTAEEKLQLQCDAENAVKGKMTLIDCPVCNNKGFVSVVKDNEIVTQECECMQRRLFIERLSANGLDEQAKVKKFNNYEVTMPFQADLQKMVYTYATTDTDQWLYIGGQRGCGKTHLCIAAAVKLTKKHNVQYFVWEDNSEDLTGGSFSGEAERRKKIELIKTAQVLYIDDFLRKPKPEPREIRLAFEIINYRYNKNLRTIITSEKTLAELYSSVDSAIAGRIAEMCGDFKYSVNEDPKKDYRIHGGK